MTPDEAITVLIPTSPIPSHPSTAIIDQTIASIRYWLPEAQIWIMADGVRPEQWEAYAVNYSMYRCNLQERMRLKEYGEHCASVFYGKQIHQVEMTRGSLANVCTPLILFCEHDTPLVTDRPIDWQGIVDVLLSGDAECIRFHYESRITPYHLYLFEEQFESHGVPLWRTKQFCARPHVATVDFYKRALAVFSPEANSMIEDRLITFVEHQPWENWRVAVYNPPDSMHRSLHLDGRGTDPKFEAEMRF